MKSRDDQRMDLSAGRLADDGEELDLNYTMNRFYALHLRYLDEIGKLQDENQELRKQICKLTNSEVSV